MSRARRCVFLQPTDTIAFRKCQPPSKLQEHASACVTPTRLSSSFSYGVPRKEKQERLLLLFLRAWELLSDYNNGSRQLLHQRIRRGDREAAPWSNTGERSDWQMLQGRQLRHRGREPACLNPGSCPAPPLQFICGVSKASAAFSIRKFGESLHTCHLKDGSAKEIQKFIQWVLFFFCCSQKRNSFICT